MPSMEYRAKSRERDGEGLLSLIVLFSLTLSQPLIISYESSLHSLYTPLPALTLLLTLPLSAVTSTSYTP